MFFLPLGRVQQVAGKRPHDIIHSRIAPYHVSQSACALHSRHAIKVPEPCLDSCSFSRITKVHHRRSCRHAHCCCLIVTEVMASHSLSGSRGGSRTWRSMLSTAQPEHHPRSSRYQCFTRVAKEQSAATSPEPYSVVSGFSHCRIQPTEVGLRFVQ